MLAHKFSPSMKNIPKLWFRGEAKLLTKDWEGVVADIKSAAEKSPRDMSIRESLMKAEKALNISQRKDWYKILGVSKTSTISEIKWAYKKLALQWYQDKNVDNIEEAENKFRDIAATYEILGDDDKRVRYDHGEDIEVCNWLTFKSMVVMVFDF